jgi:hypothetical protein
MKLSIELPTDVQAALLRLAVTEFRATDKQAAYLLTQLLRKGQPGAGETLPKSADLQAWEHETFQDWQRRQQE